MTFNCTTEILITGLIQYTFDYFLGSFRLSVFRLYKLNKNVQTYYFQILCINYFEFKYRSKLFVITYVNLFSLNLFIHLNYLIICSYISFNM